MKARAGAIIGFGHVAAQGHVPVWRTRSDAHIVAVADIDPARQSLARTLLPGVRVYADSMSLLARERLDFVDIATPPRAHIDVIEHALRAGCAVLCEKPLVTTTADFARAATWVRETSGTLVTVHNWKHSDQFRHVARLVADGTIGQVSRIALTIERNGQAASVGSSWRRDAEQAGGGILFDHGWHSVYLALALGAEAPRRIRARIDRRGSSGSDVEDTAWCRIELPSAVAEIYLTWAAAHRHTQWHIVGTNGAIDVDEDRLTVHTADHPQHVRFPHSLSTGSHHPDWFDAVIDDFFRAIDDPATRLANLTEAQWCITILSLAYQSAARGASLPLPPGMPALLRAATPQWPLESAADARQ